MALPRRRLESSNWFRPRRHSATIILKSVAAVAAGIALALTQAGTGHADPSQAELETQIDTQWNELEPIIEQHNLLRSNLEDTQAKVADLTAKLAPLEAQVNEVTSRISAIAVRYYMGSSPSSLNSMLSTGSPTTFIEQMSFLNRIAHTDMEAIQEAVDLKAQYDTEKEPLDALLEEQTAQEEQLAEQEGTINAEIERLNELRIQAYGTTLSSGPTTLAPCPYEYYPDAGGRAASIACDQIGKKYVFGTAGPTTFDCSGLTMYAWAHADAGVTLRHYTQWQYEDTKRVSEADLRPGDLIFYYSDRHHMGMYVGGGYIVHAPNSSDVVRMKRYDAAPISGYGRPVTSAA